MLRTNSKKARENVRALILKCTDFENYADFDGVEVCPENFAGVASALVAIFKTNKAEALRRYPCAASAVFSDWLAGLPSALNSGAWYLGDAVDVLGDILEESAAERGRYSEDAARGLLDRLVWDELQKAI